MKREPKSAVKLKILENSEPISAETEAIQSRVRQRAFEISNRRPQNLHEVYDWLMAESEIVTIPPAELTEKESKFELKFAVGGVNPEDVTIMVTPESILLKSEYTHEHESDVGTIHFCDFRSATVFRSVELPSPIDVESVKAHCLNGIISVTAYKQGAEPAAAKRPAARKGAPKKSQAKMP